MPVPSNPMLIGSGVLVCCWLQIGKFGAPFGHWPVPGTIGSAKLVPYWNET